SPGGNTPGGRPGRMGAPRGAPPLGPAGPAPDGEGGSPPSPFPPPGPGPVPQHLGPPPPRGGARPGGQHRRGRPAGRLGLGPRGLCGRLPGRPAVRPGGPPPPRSGPAQQPDPV